MEDMWWERVTKVKTTLETLSINYCFTNKTALILQDSIPKNWQKTPIEVSIQWDQLQTAYNAFAKYERSPIKYEKQMGEFTVNLDETVLLITCQFNYVVATDPDRISLKKFDQSFYVKALQSFLNPVPESPYRELVISHLRQEQEKINQHNKRAWTTDAYQAWVTRFGEPQAVAQKISKNPESFLTHLLPYFGSLENKKVMNLLGSNGLKAIACARLGAEAGVIDISPENARYAKEVAELTGVSLDYRVSDVLSLPDSAFTEDYDYVLMEKGILHYFLYLPSLFHVVSKLLKPGGTLILEDFHPISVKLIESKGKKHKASGNYFDKSLKQVPVAFGKHLKDRSTAPFVYEKYWTLGEIVTAIAECRLMISALYEQPNIKKDDSGIPKTFLITARKINN